MQIEDFHVSVGKIIPKFDGESAKYVNINSPAGGIIFRVIAESRWRRGYVPETLKQAPLLT